MFEGQRRVHYFCTGGRVLPSAGDRVGRNGLRPPPVREARVAESGRPFTGSGLDSHVLHALCRRDESRPDPCSRQGPADGSRRCAQPRPLAEPRRRSWRNATGANSDAAPVVAVATAPLGVVASDVASTMVGVATTTIAAEATAVVEGGEGATGVGVAQGAAEGETLVATTGAVAAGLAEATEGRRTAREDVQRGKARQFSPAHLRPIARTTARWPW